MTSSMICHLWCDHNGCPAEWTGASAAVVETRREARREGWRTTGGGSGGRLRDWCPGHDPTALLTTLSGEDAT